MIQKKRFSPSDIVFPLLICLIALALFYPQSLFFLSPVQQQAVADFQNSYFSAANPIGEGSSIQPSSILAVLILIAEAFLVNKVIVFISQKIKFKKGKFETIKSLTTNCLKYAVVIYTIIFGLSILGINMVGVIAGLGILGLVVGFSAQSLIEDVICGLFIIFEGQFQVGDIVSIDDFRGTVTSIGIRTTNLTDGGGNIKIISNSDIRTITNLSEMESFAVADIGISYSASLEEAERVIEELLADLPNMYPEVFHLQPSYSGVQELAESAVILRVVASVDEPDIYKARRLLNRELKLCMDRMNIDIPFRQVVVHQAK